MLRRDQVVGDRVFLFQAKTGVPVYCPIPAWVVAALNDASRTNHVYHFWTGESKPKSAVGNWQRSLRSCSGWPASKTDTLTDSGTPLRSTCCLRECPWNVFQYCWDTGAFALQRSTTPLGCGPGRSS